MIECFYGRNIINYKMTSKTMPTIEHIVNRLLSKYGGLIPVRMDLYYDKLSYTNVDEYAHMANVSKLIDSLVGDNDATYGHVAHFITTEWGDAIGHVAEVLVLIDENILPMCYRPATIIGKLWGIQYDEFIGKSALFKFPPTKEDMIFRQYDKPTIIRKGDTMLIDKLCLGISELINPIHSNNKRVLIAEDYNSWVRNTIERSGR